MEGREDLLERLVKATERNADANERIVSLASEEQVQALAYQPGPPFCPHCGTFNPTVANGGGGGPMAEFVLAGTCQNCNNSLFALPEGWQVYGTEQEAREALIDKKEAGNGTS